MLVASSRPSIQVYNEVNDEPTAPSESDIEEFAKRIGIDLQNEPHLKYLAEEGLLASLPAGWKPCKDLNKNSYYYHNTKTKVSQWTHPLDDEYKLKVTQARQDFAMNKIQGVGNLGRPPSKQLPPLKKLGSSKPPPAGVLNKLGPLSGSGSSTGDGTDSKDNRSSTNSSNNVGISRVGGGDRLKNESEVQSVIVEASLQNPSERMVKKPLGGLTLTGEGSKFLKGENASNDSTKKASVGSVSSVQSKSILSSSLNQTQRSGLTSQDRVNDSGRKLEGIGKTGPSGPSILTEEEKKVIEELQGDTISNSKPSVKFQLEDNVEIKFNKPTEEDETSEEESSGSTSESDSSGSEKSADPPVKVGTLTDKKPIVPEPMPRPNRMSNLQNRSEAATEAVKDSLRDSVESKIKEFQQQLDNERRKREDQIQQQTETAIAKLKVEKDEELKRIRVQSDREKNIQLEKIKREMEANVSTEIKKIQQQFQKELETKKSQLEMKHKQSLDELANNAKVKETENAESLMNEQKTAEFATMQASLKEQKESMKEDHKKQVQQMKDYYASYLKNLESGFKAEENRLKNEHKTRVSALTASFEKEISEMKSKNVSSMKQMVDKLEKEKQTKLQELQKEISELKLQEQQKSVETINTAHKVVSKEDIQTQTETVENTKVQDVPSKSVNGVSSKTALRDPEVGSDEMKDLNAKYYQLEKKYKYLKRELRKITPKVSESSMKISSTNENLPPARVPASKSEPYDLNKHVFQSNDELPSCNERNLSRDVEETIQSSDNGVSESHSESTFYPSSHPLHSENIYPPHETSPQPTPEVNDDKLVNALESLELLKVQILAMKDEARKSEAVKLAKSDSHADKKSYSNQNHKSSVSRKKNSSGYAGQPIPNKTQSSRGERVVVGGMRGARSTSELPGLVEDSHEELSHEVVKEAKEFIRSQKERLNGPNMPESPVRTAWSTPNTVRKRPLHYSVDMDEMSYPPSLNRIPNYSSLKRSPKIKNSLDLYSETESSGIGSLKDLESQEKKQISKDIETICSSLSNLDHQMKLMWSVVQGGGSQGMVVENNKSNLNALLSSQRNKSGRPYSSVSATLPTTPLTSYDISGLSPSNRALLESLKAAALPSSRVPSTKSTNLLVTSLDQQIKEFNAAKDKILHQFESNDNNTLPGSDRSGSIQAKTKDLREWLEKF